MGVWFMWCGVGLQTWISVIRKWGDGSIVEVSDT